MKYLAILLFFLLACQPEKENISESKNLVLSPEKALEVENILESLPNPLETCNFISDLDCDSSDLSLNTNLIGINKDLAKYQSSYKMAVNMGVYRTDLYYCSHNKRYENARNYLYAIGKLQSEMLAHSDLLKKRLFALEKVKSKEMINLDSMVLVQTNFFFEDMKGHFTKLSKDEVNTLIELGSWVEVMYLATLYYEKKPCQPLKERIVEQMIIVEQLFSALEIFKNRSGIRNIHQEMRKLKNIYAKINKKSPSSKPIKFLHTETDYDLIFDDFEKEYAVENSDQQMLDLCESLKKMRSNLIQ
ncbi:MAG: hypothetical protein EAZ97_02080 [Bacteroidetes bacterium]|nr:MAG: hypothetical protein EAZ97_02080 [Bacteroidota bacterium]